MTSVPRSADTSEDCMAESRRRQSKRDEAIRRKIELDLSKRKRDSTAFKRLRQGQPGTVLLLRPSPPIICAPSTSVYQAAQLMLAKRENCVLVVDIEESLVGIFTAKDLAFRVVGSNVAATLVSVDLIMTPDPVCANANDPASEALRLMVERRFRHLPVLDSESRMVGVLDITKCYAAQMEKLERLHASSLQLNDALESVLEEMGAAGLHPAHVFEYFEDLRSKMNGPDLLSVLNDKTAPVYIKVKANVFDATVLMKHHGTTALLVKDSQGSVVGIFTSKDVVLRVIAAGIDPKNCSIVRVMTLQPDVVLLLLPIQQALRQMLERHYLNLPVADEDGSIIGMVEVLHLTYATLRQIEQAEADVEINQQGSTSPGKPTAQLVEGPAWKQFWTSLDYENTLDSIHSASRSFRQRSQNLAQSTNLQVLPSDSASHTGAQSRGCDCEHSSAPRIAPQPERAFTFKFRSGRTGGRNHRLAIYPQDGFLELYRLIDFELNKEDYDALGAAKDPDNDYNNVAISYVDEDGDEVAITCDNSLRECIETFRAASTNKAFLLLHSPHKSVQKKATKSLTGSRMGAFQYNVILATGVVAIVAAVSVVAARYIRKP